MTPLLAPPELLSAYAFAEDGSGPDLPRGTHLRLFAGLGASFPLTPFAVFRLRSQEAEPRRVHVTDRAGKPVGGLDLSQLGAADATLLLSDSGLSRTVRAELFPDAPGGLRSAQLLDQRGRVVAERNAPRWLFSAPVLHGLRLRGSARAVGVRTRRVNLGDLVSQNQLAPPELAGVLGLPVQGLHTWYVGLQDRRGGLDRVANAAPLRLNPLDRPEGPLGEVGPAEEVARVEALLRSARLGGGLERLLATLLDDGTQPPWLQVEQEELPPAQGGARQFASVPRLGTLQLAAFDPGLARFLGFADRLDDLPDLEGEGGWDTLAVVGLFALDPQAFDPGGQGQLLRDADPDEGPLTELLLSALARTLGAGDRDLRREVEAVTRQARGRGLVVRACVTLAAPVPPWLPPALPKPEVLQRRWQTAPDGAPSSLYRASFAFARAPLAFMSAVACQLGGEWRSRHGTVDVGPFEPPSRATPRLFGHEQEAGSRLRELGQLELGQLELGQSGSFERAGLLADQDLPAGAGAILYRFRASDFFGRFGEPAELEVEPPPRPAPPPPVLRFSVERTVPDPASPDALSPGVLKMSFAVPRALPGERFTDAERERLASALLVPAPEDLAAGSLRLTSFLVTLEDQTQTVDVTAAGVTDIEFALPALLPQERRTLTLSAVFQDSAGVSSAAATLPVPLVDVRPPRAYPTGLGLFWTSAPGPSPDVELKLSWPAPEGSLHRVYLTDQQGLGLTPEELSAAELAELSGAGPSRGRVAQVGGNKVLDGGAVKRSGFRLLTDPPLKAGADGRVLFGTTLPRSLATVQFLRVVPLSAEGAEAPFDTCGIVPVAVPDSRRPPAPWLAGVVDGVTGTARLTIRAEGFDRAALERDEPGLFQPGAEGSQPPEYRLRRAVGAVADPLYARPVAAGALALEAAAPEPVFAATVTDDNAGRGLEPFVRYVYWAEVRLPPERCLPAGVLPIHPPGGISAADPAGAVSQPRPLSLPSAPRVLMRVPGAPPAAPSAAAVTATRTPPDDAGKVEVTIRVAGAPRAHARAVAPYRLAIWSQWPGQAIQAVTRANGADLEGSWPDFNPGEAEGEGVVTAVVNLPASVAAASPLTLRLAFADPLGRLSDLTPPIPVA